MKDQHTKIKGYRDLTQREIDLMNAIKAKGLELQTLVADVRQHLHDQREAAVAQEDEIKRIGTAEPGRWASIGSTHFQEGLMALTRAVAQPGTY